MAVTREIALQELAQRQAAAEVSDTFSLPDYETDETHRTDAAQTSALGVYFDRQDTADAATPVKGLPAASYKPTQQQWALDLVNVNKALKEAVLRQIDHLKVRYPTEVDQRSVAIARTQTEDMFMRLNLAIFQPQRILDGPTSEVADQILRAADSKAAL
jgi:hypothetical protein